jgi:hypothetical protein
VILWKCASPAAPPLGRSLRPFGVQGLAVFFPMIAVLALLSPQALAAVADLRHTAVLLMDCTP